MWSHAALSDYCWTVSSPALSLVGAAGAPPTGSQLSGSDFELSIQPAVRERRSSGGEWGKRRGLAFSLGPFSSPSPGPAREPGAQGTGWGLVLQGSRAFTRTAPWLGSHLEVVTRSLIPACETSQLRPSACVTVCGACPRHTGSLQRQRAVRAWVPSSLSDGSWSRSGGLALRELPAEICLLSASTRPQRVTVLPGTVSFFVRTEHIIQLMEVYRTIVP